MALGRVLALALVCHGVIAGPPALDAHSAPRTRKLHGRFLHITDFHPDEYYKVHSSTDEDDACHRGTGPAGPYGAETSDCDSPFSLVNATFDWIAANLKDTVDFVVWTGDSARHDRDEDLPRNADQVLGTNIWLADRFADLFAQDGGGMGLAIPVVPNFGNNDILPHNILLPGPNKWLQQYAHIWRRFIPEEQRHSFEFGGWFDVEVIPNQLAVFSLNTLYFFDRNAGVDGCADPSEPGYKQLEWLSVQLQFLRERGMKAILIGHVPPARTESKMLWDETCWHKYSLWVHQFRDVVLVGLYGHMNIDHYIVADSNDINIAAMAASSEIGTRQALDGELSVQSASDYLMELRHNWAKLTPPPAGDKDVDKKGRRKKGKKSRDPWGERYHLSLVSPSVVPNYFPTLRVLEYNITGLENAPVWRDTFQTDIPDPEHAQKHLELRRHELDDIDTTAPSITEKKHRKDKDSKKKKKKTPPTHDPNLHIPAPPSKTAPPGPAYSPQPLTLTGYTQYYANLTHINNLNLTSDDTTTAAALDFNIDGGGGQQEGWEFAFEVEYSTFEDRIYRLEDLTVKSLVRLAVRIGHGEDEGEEEEQVSDDGDDETEDDEEEEEVETEKKKKKKHKGGKGKKGKKRKQNKTWLHFLRHAFANHQTDAAPMTPILRLPTRRRLRRRRMATLLLPLLLLALLLCLPLYVLYKPPSPLLRYLAHRWTDVLFRVWLPPSKPLVALTIDDAPSDHTRAILAALRDAGAHATFFVVGAQVAGREDVLRDVVRAGHELANHGMRDEPAAGLTAAELEDQIRATQDLIDAAYIAWGREPPAQGHHIRGARYYRPGSGFFSERVREVAGRLGYRVVLGSIYPYDAQIGWAWLNARHVLSMLSPGGVVICHDRRSWTEPMLRRVLPELKRRGYEAVTLTRLLAEVTG
ncbi:carbohydrate esterase family 4 protein [Parathielavia hyrcaniae]|uniref:Carbohydrate esterase family 4 protein n=1 Tax=Parathielavia hyrcaniae TaxID=113614 RepID=A0AAN6Q3W1_9PEZI|nr:carbohydrate esterase family 4 protein [Parathielavia hyrcaniae]